MQHINPLILIVEGPDRCGKGTFIDTFKSIVTSHNIVHMHSSKPPAKFFIDQQGNPVFLNKTQKIWARNYNENLLKNVDILSKTNSVIILDRSYIGEYVYGSLYRNAKYTDDDFLQFEKSHLNLKGKHVLLINFEDTPDNLIAREDGNSHSNAYGDKFRELEMFRALHEMSAIPNKRTINWAKTAFNTEALTRLTKDIISDWTITTEGIQNAN